MANERMVNIVEASVMYLDYMGVAQEGTIIYLEPTEEEGVHWCYLKDVVESHNNKPININGVNDYYAELRLSTEVYIKD